MSRFTRQPTALSLAALSALLSVTTLTACSGGSNPDLAAVLTPAGDTKDISGVTFLKGANETMYAANPLAEVQSANHFEIDFSIEPGGSLTLVANAILTPETGVLDRGVEFEFRRSTNAGEQALTVLVRASGAERNWSQFFTSLDARGTIAIGVDVHNDHGGEAHIIAWGADHENPIFNSGIRSAGGSPGRGFGARWGFKSTNSTVSAVKLETPHDEH